MEGFLRFSGEVSVQHDGMLITKTKGISHMYRDDVVDLVLKNLSSSFTLHAYTHSWIS